MILSLLFTAPDLSDSGKLVYAYSTYIIFTLIYTANNVPYGALMSVMTGDDKERTSIGSFRMVGAFTGGMLVQGALLFLVASFGNVNPNIDVNKIDTDKFEITVSVPRDVENAYINTDNSIALFSYSSIENKDDVPTTGKSFHIKANKEYSFIVSGDSTITSDSISIIDQKQGYSNSMYLMSVFLTLFMFITFYSTKERVKPPKAQESNLKQDFKDLIGNRPWLVLLVIGLLFNIYNSIKQGIVVIYFTHYLHNQLLAASFMIGLTLASIGGAMVTAPLGRRWGKKRLFIYSLIFSGVVNAFLILFKPGDIVGIFSIGIISEFAAAIFPTLFFVMLGDTADYSEFKNGRRATGLVYSAGSFATKFGGGIAGAIIGFVLAYFQYDGTDTVAIQGAVPGIKMLMSWIPTVIALIAAALMTIYPLTQEKISEVTEELNRRRSEEIT